MPFTIFYSWQSDLPNKTNRGFIGQCLTAAINELSRDLEIKNANRDAGLEMDKDTQGVPGSPPIADTIFGKVDECVAFVADISFVGKRNKVNENQPDRPMPNANVMTEYGYAVKAKGNDRIIRVMNEAYGGPVSKDGRELLPFDMKHLRWPITYNLPENADAAIRKKVKTELTKTFKIAIGAVIDKFGLEETLARLSFPESEVGYAPSTFLDEGEELLSEMSFHSDEQVTYYLGSLPHAFIRMMPIHADNASFKYREINKLVTHEYPPLFKMRGQRRTSDNGRNKYGLVMHDGNYDSSYVRNCLQLFESGELWATSTDILFEVKDKNFLSLPPFEAPFKNAFHEYRNFMSNNLNFSYPFRFVVGMVGIEKSRLNMPSRKGHWWPEPFQGLCILNEIIFEGEVGEDESTIDTLLPFFEDIWDAFNRPRPDFLYEEDE